MPIKSFKPKGIIIIFSIISGIILGFLIKSNLDAYTPMTSKSIIEAQEDLAVLEEEVKELELIYKDRNRQLRKLEDKLNPTRDIEKEILDELE